MNGINLFLMILALNHSFIYSKKKHHSKSNNEAKKHRILI